MAEPPVMIMAVSAAPSRVPATPNLEVTSAAPAEATPADMTCVPLTTGPCLAASLMGSSLPTDPPGFKACGHLIVQTFCGGGHRGTVRIRPEGGEGKVSDGGSEGE